MEYCVGSASDILEGDYFSYGKIFVCGIEYT